MHQDRLIQVGAVSAALAGAIAVLATGPVFPLDDAYITLHNARVLLAGGVDEVYGVPPLVGATSPIHLALTALALLITPSAPEGALLVATLGAALYLLGAAALAAQRALKPWQAAAVVAIATDSGFAAYHLFNGLETPWAMAGVTWALVLAGRTQPGRGLPFLCGLLPFLRPELAVLSGLLLTHQAWRRWRAGPGWMAAVLSDLALCAIFAAPWLVWMLAATGSVSPGAGMAKRAFFAESDWPILAKVSTVGLAVLLGVGGPLVALALAPRSALTIACLTFLLVFAAAFAATFPGGLTHNHLRYVYVLLPIGLWAICQMKSRRLLSPLLLVCLAGAALSTVRSVHAYRTDLQTTREHLLVAAWAEAHLPTAARILVHDAGVPAYSAGRALTDLVGLKTPSSAKVHERVTEPSGGAARGAAVHAIALQARATHAIILQDKAGFWAKAAVDLRSHGWTLTPVGPSTPSYRLYALKAPRA